MKSERRLAVSEVFYSIQGEGPTAGTPSVFLRLSGCNLMCGGPGTQKDGQLHNGATWRCDTIEVWMQGTHKLTDQIFDEEQRTALKNGAHLIVTGGEPMMQQRPMAEMIRHYRNALGVDFPVEIETNGTVYPVNELEEIGGLKKIRFNCSPKLSNSGNKKNVRLRPEVIEDLNFKDTIFKFVISGWNDWEEILEEWLPLIDYRKICLMPAGDSQEELAKKRQTVASIATLEWVQYSDRLHIVLWNQKTGV